MRGSLTAVDNDRIFVSSFEFGDCGKAFDNGYLDTQSASALHFCSVLLSTFSCEVFAVAYAMSVPAGFPPVKYLFLFIQRCVKELMV